MAIINKGTAFSNGEQLSASKLNDLVDGATFGTDSVDNASTIVNANGAITVRDSGVTAAKLATGSVTTNKIVNANVTKAKIENVSDYKVLGNVSGAAAAPQEVAILDEDDMVSDSDTALATQQSIKAYVDATAGGFTPSTYVGGESVTLPNGLIMKFGQVAPASRSQHQGEYLLSFASSFPNSIITATTSILTTSGYPDNHAFVDDLAVSGIRLVSGSTVNGTSTYGWTWTAFGY